MDVREPVTWQTRTARQKDVSATTSGDCRGGLSPIMIATIARNIELQFVGVLLDMRVAEGTGARS